MLKKLPLIVILSFLVLLILPKRAAAEQVLTDWLGDYQVEGSRVKGISLEEDCFTIYYEGDDIRDFNEDPFVDLATDWYNRNLYGHPGTMVSPDEEVVEDPTDIEMFVELDEEHPVFTEADHMIRIISPQYKILDGRLNVYAFKTNIHFFTFLDETGDLSFQPPKGEAFIFTRVVE